MAGCGLPERRNTFGQISITGGEQHNETFDSPCFDDDEYFGHDDGSNSCVCGGDRAGNCGS